MGIVFALIQWLWAPVALLGTSIMYFQRARNGSRAERMAVSAHGVVLAVLYLAALAVHMADAAQPRLAVWFAWSLALPAVLVGFSILRFKGNRAVHFLQLGKLVCAAWVWFVGTMAVTGNWL